MEVGEAYGERVGVGMEFEEFEGDVFGVIPGESGHLSIG
jgi:hypothetical protein